ncbi:MAG: ROK family protein [Thermoguttaceae bacterium]|nr:ROK family protein [Thermoguttaceae bacterium]
MSSKDNPYFVGVDLGGTNMKIGVMDNHGETLVYDSIPTLVERGPDDAVRRMAAGIHKAVKKAGLTPKDIARVGLGSPGTMDIPAGMLVRPSNLPGWDFFPIRDRLAAESGFGVTFANDATAAAFAEYWVGAGKGEQGLVVLTLGTGIGCGIILEGRPWDGCHSHGGEAAHNLIDISQNARWCKCGQRGHFEAYASATGVANRTIEMVNAELKTTLAPRVRKAPRRDMVPKIVFEEAEKGDKLAIRIVEETAYYLAIGMVSLTHTIDPSCFLIGGAMTFGGNASKTGRLFLRRTKAELKSRIFLHLAERLRVKFALLGGDAGYIGAAGLARQEWAKEER